LLGNFGDAFCAGYTSAVRNRMAGYVDLNAPQFAGIRCVNEPAGDSRSEQPFYGHSHSSAGFACADDVDVAKRFEVVWPLAVGDEHFAFAAYVPQHGLHWIGGSKRCAKDSQRVAARRASHQLENRQLQNLGHHRGRIVGVRFNPILGFAVSLAPIVEQLTEFVRVARQRPMHRLPL
jgi:hypothetical protein